MKKLFLLLPALCLSFVLNAQNAHSLSPEPLDVITNLERIQTLNNPASNQVRGGKNICLDSIIYEKDGRLTITRNTYKDNQCLSSIISTYESGTLTSQKGFEYIYDTRLKEIRYVETDLNTGQKRTQSVESLSYNGKGFVESSTYSTLIAGVLSMESKTEYDYFNGLLFRLRRFSYDEVSGSFVPTRRLFFDRIPDGDFKEVLSEIYDENADLFIKNGFNEYDYSDNQILESIFKIDVATNKSELTANTEFIFDPISKKLNHRNYQVNDADAFSWNHEFRYDVHDELETIIVGYEYANSEENSYIRKDHLYDQNYDKSSLITPPSLIYSGFVGIGLTYDPEVFHHKLDQVNMTFLDHQYNITKEFTTDYYWSEKGITSTSDLEAFTFKIHPNPTSDILNISSSSVDDLEINIVNAEGKIVHRQNIQRDTNINVRDWPKGAYTIVGITSSNQVEQIQFIKAD